MKRIMILVAATACALSACGTTQGDRAGSGGLMGAGAGAAVDAMVGNPAAGAVIGGVAGAATGTLSDPSDLNLGAPVWRSRHASREDYRRRCGHDPR